MVAGLGFSLRWRIQPQLNQKEAPENAKFWEAFVALCKCWEMMFGSDLLLHVVLWGAFVGKWMPHSWLKGIFRERYRIASMMFRAFIFRFSPFVKHDWQHYSFRRMIFAMCVEDYFGCILAERFVSGSVSLVKRGMSEDDLSIMIWQFPLWCTSTAVLCCMCTALGASTVQ